MDIQVFCDGVMECDMIAGLEESLGSILASAADDHCSRTGFEVSDVVVHMAGTVAWPLACSRSGVVWVAVDLSGASGGCEPPLSKGHLSDPRTSSHSFARWKMSSTRMSRSLWWHRLSSATSLELEAVL